MTTSWLIRRGCKKLILFCSGWGMDERPFHKLTSPHYDVMICYDYGTSSAAPDIDRLQKKYESVYLLAWSIGVYFAQKYFRGKEILFSRTIALNGTLRPVDEEFGIHPEIFAATRANLDEASLQKFYRRMCGGKDTLVEFMQHRPARSLHSLQEELDSLGKVQHAKSNTLSIYSDIVVSNRDFIIPTSHQLNFWHSLPVKIIQGSHFPFYRVSSWDDLLQQLLGV